MSIGSSHWVTLVVVSGPIGAGKSVLAHALAARLVAAIEANGGEIVKARYREPPDAEDALSVATFRDPAGNVLGIWNSPP